MPVQSKQHRSLQFTPHGNAGHRIGYWSLPRASPESPRSLPSRIPYLHNHLKMYKKKHPANLVQFHPILPNCRRYKTNSTSSPSCTILRVPLTHLGITPNGLVHGLAVGPRGQAASLEAVTGCWQAYLRGRFEEARVAAATLANLPPWYPQRPGGCLQEVWRSSNPPLSVCQFGRASRFEFSPHVLPNLAFVLFLFIFYLVLFHLCQLVA